MRLLFAYILKWNLTFLFFNESLFRNTLGYGFHLEHVSNWFTGYGRYGSCQYMLKSGNKSGKHLATEFENNSNHNKNNQSKR